LAPKVFQVLDYLVRHAGRLVTQEELLEAVWPETYVQPEILRTYILEIRKALDDPAKKPRFIETLPKRGYRFIAPLTEEVATTPVEPAPDTLVGRETLLAELQGHLDQASRGHRRIVFITGEPGIGKTSLVDAFAHSAAGEPAVRVVRGQCVEGFGGKEAYYPILEAFGALLQTPAREVLVRTLASRAPTWLIQFPSAVTPQQDETLRRELVGATRDRMVRELCDALETLTADHPLILILEDLQWVDNPTLDVISAVARRRSPARLLLLATYRPVDVILSRSPLRLLKQELLVHRLCQEIALTGLSENDVERHLETRFPGRNVAPRLAGSIHRHSDGNPLFMRAILEHLVQTGVIQQREQRWIVKAPPEIARLDIPETLQQMLEAQLDQLPVSEQKLLRTASVVGGRFSAWAAGVLLDTSPQRVEEICDNLVSQQRFLKRVGTPESMNGSSLADYEFRHILYREVLYRQLNRTQRRQFHLQLASRMEVLPAAAEATLASELAFHFEEGQDYDKAIHHLILSARNAMRRYAHGDAIQLLHHALDLLPHVSAEAGRELELDILEKISDALYAQGEMLQSAEIDHRTAELAAQLGDRVAQVHSLTRVARALAFLDPARCIAVCDRAAEVSRTVNDPLLRARAELLGASWHIVANGWTPAEADACAAARTRLRNLNQELTAYYEILYAHVQCIQGDYQEALQTARAGVPKAVENGSLAVYLSAHSSLAHALLHVGEWGELHRVLKSAREVADKNGNAPWQGIIQASLAWLHFHACDYEGAVRFARSLLRDYQEEPAGQVRTMAMVTAAFAETERGSAVDAIPALESVCERREHARFFLDWYWRMMARLGLSRAWLVKGHRENAGREAQLFLEAALSTTDPNLQALAWEMQARVSTQPALALEHLKKGFAALETSMVPSAAWRLHATAARLHAGLGDSAKAEHHREQAAAILHQLALSLQEGGSLRKSLEAASRRSLGRAT
jgi:tetratricopeptide (TPR) repeat protein